MNNPLIPILLALVASVSAETISVTPHDSFSSSVGILGCFINTDRVAYFPEFPNCAKPCVRLTASGRQVTLLHIDSSTGSHDISYDAWNYLSTGESAEINPTMGGGIEVTKEELPLSDPACDALLHGGGSGKGKFPIMAISPNWGLTCPADKVEYWNFGTATCTRGVGELCDLGGTVNPCPSGFQGIHTPYEAPDEGPFKVDNLKYGTKNREQAL